MPCDPKGEGAQVVRACGNEPIALGRGLPARVNPLDSAHDPRAWPARRGTGRCSRGATGCSPRSPLRTLDWKHTGQGRRLYDLRHTAAYLWLTRRVDAGTVQNWMGHESIATTNRYLHFLGTGADLAGLDRLNEDPGVPRGYQEGR